jgi:hypothetical protein
VYNRPTVIGSITVPEGYEHTKQDYETAAWWSRIAVVPGEYNLVATFNDLTPDKVYWVSFSLCGTVVDEYFASLWGGVPISGESNAKIGRQDVHRLQEYGFSAAQEYANRGTILGFPAKLFDHVVISSQLYDAGNGRIGVLYSMTVGKVELV